MIISAGTLVTGREVLSPGWLDVRDGVVTAVGSGFPSRPPGTAHGQDAVIVPGFVDMHVHGGGGFAYTSDTSDDVLRAVDFHRERGTTTTLASLVSADEPSLIRSIRLLADLVRDGAVAGIHLEGPWLNPARRGAHDLRHLRDPDPALLERLVDAGGGAVRMITLAPELPGGIDLVSRIVDAGVVAAIGHTDASYATTCTAIDAGATVATHLFNAMAPLHHREPGPIGALLNDSRVMLEMIADGVHQHPAVLSLVCRAATAQRIALVTDAMAATGMPDGEYWLGPVAVRVTDRVARLRDSGTIAGSTVTMDRLFAAAADPSAALPASREQALLAATAMTSANPARALGLDAGLLEPGHPADIVVLDADLRVRP